MRLSQASLVASLTALRLATAALVCERDVHLSYVPLAHIFERSVLSLCLVSGAAVGFYHGTQVTLQDVTHRHDTACSHLCSTLHTSVFTD